MQGACCVQETMAPWRVGACRRKGATLTRAVFVDGAGATSAALTQCAMLIPWVLAHTCCLLLPLGQTIRQGMFDRSNTVDPVKLT